MGGLKLKNSVSIHGRNAQFVRNSTIIRPFSIVFDIIFASSKLPSPSSEPKIKTLKTLQFRLTFELSGKIPDHWRKSNVRKNFEQETGNWMQENAEEERNRTGKPIWEARCKNSRQLHDGFGRSWTEETDGNLTSSCTD